MERFFKVLKSKGPPYNKQCLVVALREILMGQCPKYLEAVWPTDI